MNVLKQQRHIAVQQQLHVCDIKLLFSSRESCSFEDSNFFLCVLFSQTNFVTCRHKINFIILQKSNFEAFSVLRSRLECRWPVKPNDVTNTCEPALGDGGEEGRYL